MSLIILDENDSAIPVVTVMNFHHRLLSHIGIRDWEFAVPQSVAEADSFYASEARAGVIVGRGLCVLSTDADGAPCFFIRHSGVRCSSSMRSSGARQ